MTWSRSYANSRGGLSCMTCHNPHGNAETSVSFYEARCLACRTPGSPGTPRSPVANPRLPILPEDVRRVACSVNLAKGWLECHMPKIEGIVPHTKFTDHRIRVRTQAAPIGGPSSRRS